MKKIILFITTLILSFIGTFAFAIDENQVGENFKDTPSGLKFEITAIGDNNTVKVIYDDPKYSGNIIIPATVEYNDITFSVNEIGADAFYECTDLLSVYIPNSVVTIGDESFKFCENLTSLEIPNSVISIGDKAFEWCENLTSITLGTSVKTIGAEAFYYCLKLPNFAIPASVETIKNNAFLGCENLTSFSVDADNTYFKSVDGVLFNYAKDTLIFYPTGNQQTTYSVPSSVTTIGENAFMLCSNLTSIVIPASVTTIEAVAFDFCSGLTSIDIPESVQTIGDESFSYCTNLNTVTVAWTNKENLPTLGTNVFTHIAGGEIDGIKYATLIVPAQTKTIYETAETWEHFGEIKEASTTGLNNNFDSLANKIVKIIRNGQTLIFNKDKIYNVLGIDVE